jgi:PAS domain S-box-containing protein
MEAQEKDIQYAEIVKLFGFVLNQYRLYSERHPAARLAVRDFSTKLKQLLGSESTLTLGLIEGRLIVNDHPLDPRRTGVIDLIRECNRFQIESLIFESGAGEEEVTSFFKFMATPPKMLEGMGGFSKVFEQANFQHIRLGTARYKRVKQEELVVRKEEVGTTKEREETFPPGQARKIDKMEDLIEHCVSGAQGEIDFNNEWLAYEVEKKPEAVAKQMVERAENLEALRRIVEDIARFVQERLAVPFIKEGKDFSQPVSRLAKEFKKVLESPETPEDFRGAVGELVGILEQCADAIKVELVAMTFKQSGGDIRATAKVGGKFLRGKVAREQLLGPLREKLGALGMGEEEFAQAFSAVGERRTPKKSPQLDISHEELEELRRLRDHFEDELALRVKQETAVLEEEKRRLVSEKERVDAIVRSIGEGLVVVDNQGKVQFMNPAAERLLGLNFSGAKGVPIPQLIKDEHALALAKGPLRDEANRAAKEIELKSLNEETQRILQASSAVIENEDGKTVGMVSVLSDITKQKHLDEAKARFVTKVSHELQTPLLSIQESLTLLLGKEVGDITPEQEKYLSIAQRNIGRLSRLVDDLLDVAKLEAGKISLSPVAFELHSLIHHAVETVRSWADSRGINIEERYLKKSVDIMADPDRLTQVVTNLLGNAIKFTPQRGKITVAVDPDYPSSAVSQEPCVAVSVEDSGIGVPKEDQERIFKKFEQVSLASPQGVSSTGLGLTIAKEIVELHGGKIWVDSNVGEGSRFTFVIPRRFRNENSASDI